MIVRAEYGIICNKEDEKELVKRINKFLKNNYEYRNVYKRNDTSISAFNYDYYYFQFIKENPLWYFDLYPNEDLDGKLKFDNQETQWILYFDKQNLSENTETQNQEVNLFFDKLIDAIGYKTILLYRYKDDAEERIGNIFDDDE